jgi:hypothetical protein
MFKIEDGWIFGSLPDDKGHEWPIVRHPQGSRGPQAAGTPNLVLHTTETSGYVEQLQYPSNFQCGEGVIGQHIRLGYQGDAVFVHDAECIGIEMVGFSQLGLWLPGESTLGPTVALTAWLHRTGRIKTGVKRPRDWPMVLDRGPQAVDTYYRRLAGLWPDTPGVYGHVDLPDNHHWDPGSFNYPVFFNRVQAALEGDDVALTAAQAQAIKLAELFFGELLKDGNFNLPTGAASRIADAVKKVEAGEVTGMAQATADARYVKKGTTVTLP